jgi:hypothetical protein
MPQLVPYIIKLRDNPINNKIRDNSPIRFRKKSVKFFSNTTINRNPNPNPTDVLDKAQNLLKEQMSMASSFESQKAKDKMYREIIEFKFLKNKEDASNRAFIEKNAIAYVPLNDDLKLKIQEMNAKFTDMENMLKKESEKANNYTSV